MSCYRGDEGVVMCLFLLSVPLNLLTCQSLFPHQDRDISEVPPTSVSTSCEETGGGRGGNVNEPQISASDR